MAVPSNSLSWRIGYWERLLPKAAVNPVTGLGFDAVEHIEPEHLQPHNVFVQAYVETGVIGLASLLAIIWTFAKMLRARLRNASPGWPRMLALGATSVAIATFAQFPGENLLSQTIVYTYLAVAMTYGIRFDGLEPAQTATAAGDRERIGERVRILHVNKFAYRRGGAESYMLDLAELQRQAGHETALFAMTDSRNEPSPYSPHYPPHVEYDPMPDGVANKVRAGALMLWNRKAATGLAAVIEQFRPDVAHLHNVYHQLSPSVLRPLRQSRTPVVMTLHDFKLVCPTHAMLDHGRPCEACLPLLPPGRAAPLQERLGRRERPARIRARRAPLARRVRQRATVRVPERVPRRQDAQGRPLP